MDVGGDSLGEAEVRQPGPALGVDQDVGGLDVAVNDPLGVGGAEGGRDLLAPGHDLADRRALARLLEELFEVRPGDELQDEEGAPLGLADFVDLDEVGVRQGRGSPGLDREALEGLLGPGSAREELLDRDEAIQLRIPGAIDDAHSAASQLSLELVAAEEGGRQRPAPAGGDLGQPLQLHGVHEALGPRRRDQPVSRGDLDARAALSLEPGLESRL